MPNEVSPRSGYTPVRHGPSGVSPVRQIIDMQQEAMVDRAWSSAKVAKVKHEASERLHAAFDIGEQLTDRVGDLAAKIREKGNDPDLHQMKSFLTAAGTGMAIDVMQGQPDGEAS